MMDTGRVIPTVEGDRASRPWVKLRGYGLHGVDLPKGTLPLLFWYMCDIYHVHSLYLGRELLMPAIAQPARFFVVLAARALALLLDCELAGLFEYPIVSVGVGGRLVMCVVYLAGPIHDFVQRGRSVSISFRRFLPLSGFWVAETGINGRILNIAIVVPAFVFVMSWFPISIPDFGGAGFFGVMASSG